MDRTPPSLSRPLAHCRSHPTLIVSSTQHQAHRQSPSTQHQHPYWPVSLKSASALLPFKPHSVSALLQASNPAGVRVDKSQIPAQCTVVMRPRLHHQSAPAKQRISFGCLPTAHRCVSMMCETMQADMCTCSHACWNKGGIGAFCSLRAPETSLDAFTAKSSRENSPCSL